MLVTLVKKSWFGAQLKITFPKGSEVVDTVLNGAALALDYLAIHGKPNV
jgi:hypothetical protein